MLKILYFLLLEKLARVLLKNRGLLAISVSATCYYILMFPQLHKKVATLLSFPQVPPGYPWLALVQILCPHFQLSSAVAGR